MKSPRLVLLGIVFLGCATGRAVAPAGGQAAQVAGPPAPRECPCKGKGQPGSEASGSAATPDPGHGQAAVPVTSADPSWGSHEAPVTIVVWSDFECPFCSRVGETIDELKHAYGPAQLRLVWKNYPLPFHSHARQAAEAAMTVFALGGSKAFWKFHDLAFANQARLSGESLLAWAVASGVDRARFEEAMAAGRQRSKVDSDLAEAGRLQIQGTPAFRINGISLVGAQPSRSFRGIINSQLEAAKALMAAGMGAHAVYPALCAHNLAPAPPHSGPGPTPAPEPATLDTKVWSVPVGKEDPSRGPADALVTLVVFSDFECHFCRRLAPTLAGLMQQYGSDLRIVWKDYPLPFHRQAVPAAVLARLAAAQSGPEGFWQAHDALMGAGPRLDEPAIEAVATRLGLRFTEVKAAVADGRFQAMLDKSQDLGGKLEVRGTPCSFVNGRRLEGAQPAEAFATLIDAQLDKARDLLEAGKERAGLYAAITGATEEPFELARATVDVPGKDNPVKGSAKAKVAIQVFGDFQCPHSLRIMPTLTAIEKKSAGRVRLVWRNYPLAFHEDAALAAEAAQEVFAQKGAGAFWRYHELLFAAQTEGGLGREQLEKLARKVGADGRRLRAALDSRRHRKLVERDMEAAKKAELVEMPAVLVNDYLLSGVAPLDSYERAVARAIDESSR